MRFKILLSFLVLCIITVCISCNENPPEEVRPEDETEEPPSYSFYNLEIIGTDDGSHQTLKGDSVDASWSSDNGLVWMGTDDDGTSPFGTLTMTLTTHQQAEKLIVSSAYLSLSNVLVGTPDELDARLYTLSEVVFDAQGAVTPNFINGALISGKVEMNMTLTGPAKPGHPQTIVARGEFCAID